MQDYWALATAQLSQADEVMAGLIARYPHGQMLTRGDAFVTLARAITGQQISIKAADSVWARLVALTEITPAHIAACSVTDIRSCGYSQRKVEYLHDLARHFAAGLIVPSAWDAMSDVEIISDLTQIRGIGQWSAEMFLMFNLLRPDVLPLDDIGLQRAIAQHYPDTLPHTKAKLRQHAERWQPWRSVATWYLWRSLDPVLVAY
ncbi:DNA-3-methyladenine glycosylase family protein [Sulfuriferula nivalis]|uniref:DNA-3-methyladenine glycosylase II n=1 Tax=Sulfuriferula nivalis TaxID=2675298 RepID=A0A809RQ78_9PROT|nr:DNA-3-methyladenine glycosylase [Sulfuriferula nivalis]BBP01001.1 DNA-3-methyladenine glycosylase [Sulfuriferula nivalis]